VGVGQSEVGGKMYHVDGRKPSKYSALVYAIRKVRGREPGNKRAVFEKVTVDLLFEKTGIYHPDRKSWPHNGEIIAQSNVPHFSLVAEVANTA
jgi:hypothetical protein